MAKIPIDTRLKVEKAIEDKTIDQELRPYLGISMIGDPCPRKLWYSFRLCKKSQHSSRINRLLSRGNREEPIIIQDLESIGIKVHSTQTSCSAGAGHIKGHCDGMADNVPDAPKTTHLLEFKTANDRNFKKFKKEGVEKANPIYYGQVICYMYLLYLRRTLFIIVNKNDDDRYYERIYENNEYARELIDKGIDIINTKIPPQKLGNAAWFQCKWCNYIAICHYNDPIFKTCRTCKFSEIHEGGKWECRLYQIPITFDQQLQHCRKYKSIY
jgi:hypothetical protein